MDLARLRRWLAARARSTPHPTLLVKASTAVTTQQTFTYQGNISYTADHTFTLSAAHDQPAETTFIRGATGTGDAPWSFTEQPLAG